jgi:hypothetical protein
LLAGEVLRPPWIDHHQLVRELAQQQARKPASMTIRRRGSR